jgi:type I restriction enzyme S subunit
MGVSMLSEKRLIPSATTQDRMDSIPEDWSFVSVKAIAATRANAIVGGPFGSDLVSKDYVSVGVPVIRGQNMARHYVSGDFAFVSPGKAKQLQANTAQAGDVIFTQRGTLGQVSLVPAAPFDEYVVSQSQMKLELNARKASAEYVYQYFVSAEGKKQIIDSAIQTGVPHTNLGILKKYEIPCPPTLREQEAIGEALSDADALIDSLSLLLTKTRKIKQGAMQQLLTGKKRLPGFSGDWVTLRLDQLADIRGGGTPSTAQEQFWNGNVLWCTPTDITALEGQKYLRNTARKLTQLGMRASAAELIPANSVVMTSRATIGECAINAHPVTTNQGFKSFIPFDGVDAEFLYYLLQTQRAGFISLCSGSTFLEIGKAQLSAYEVIVPERKGEQTAIATALSEIDRSIDVLHAKLGKVKELKQGMMQALLTGRIRLVQSFADVIPLPTKPAATNPPPSQLARACISTKP